MWQRPGRLPQPKVEMERPRWLGLWRGRLKEERAEDALRFGPQDKERESAALKIESEPHLQHHLP